MTDKIDWKSAPEGSTHYNHESKQFFAQVCENIMTYCNGTWTRIEGYTIADIESAAATVKRPTPAKRLTQAVFNGLPSEYRWVAVDANSKAYAYTDDPERDEEIGIFGYFSCADRAGADYVKVGHGYDATDWQNSKIERLSDTCIDDMGIANAQKQSERLDVPTAADIDWSRQDVPEGATHWHDGEWIRWTGHKDMNLWNLDAWDDDCQWTLSAYGFHGTLEDFLADGAIPRPPVHDVTRKDPVLEMARSIEAARVAEQSERTYPHYFKDVSDVDAIDLYHVARLYDITDPALFHAFKKIACAGKRGAKDRAQDVQEAIDAMKRWQELSV